MAKYCGKQILEFSTKYDVFYHRHSNSPARPHNFYDFVSGLKSLRSVSLSSELVCCADLINPMKHLAKNDTIENLEIWYKFVCENPNSQCIFYERPNHEFLDMKHFSRLKRIRFCSDYSMRKNIDGHGCDANKLFIAYSEQILSNVEVLVFWFTDNIINLIKCTPKLRQLVGRSMLFGIDGVTGLAKVMENIVKKRNNGQTCGDFIEIQLPDGLGKFADAIGRHDFIKLSLIRYETKYHDLHHFTC